MGIAGAPPPKFSDCRSFSPRNKPPSALKKIAKNHPQCVIPLRKAACLCGRRRFCRLGKARVGRAAHFAAAFSSNSLFLCGLCTHMSTAWRVYQTMYELDLQVEGEGEGIDTRMTLLALVHSATGQTILEMFLKPKLLLALGTCNTICWLFQPKCRA